MIDLSKFTKQSKIGQGLFGKVFKVIENSTQNIFAAKISNTNLNDSNPYFIKYLNHEIGILSQLNHPLILKFIGYSPINFQGESYPVTIIEYLSNGSLSNIIDYEHRSIPPDSWTDTKKLINIYGIASAMSYLHLHNIIHRNLKPANILEDENLFPKIADFGMSKIYYENFDSTSSKSTVGFKGTPIYTAPEIWSGNEYTKAGDVYSFGMIVYEIFSIKKPFKNCKSIIDLVSRVVNDDERPEFDFPLPNCYVDLIKRCWSRKPEDRPTFQEIVNELRTNKEFIIDTINENEFFNFVDSIDSASTTFEPTKKFKAITTNAKQEQEQEQARELKKITVGIFNEMPLKDQQNTILNMTEYLEEKEKREVLLNINKLLSYILSFNIESKEQYFSIYEEDEDTTIEEVFNRRFNIKLSHQSIDKIFSTATLTTPESQETKSLKKRLRESKALKDSKESEETEETEETDQIKEIINICEYLSEIEIINIEMKYPTSKFEMIYSQVLKLAQKYEKFYLEMLNQW